MTLQRRNRNRGKNAERAVAKIFGGKRMGVLGGEDVMHPSFSIESKTTVSFVARKWMAQCENNNKDNKIPIVVHFQKHLPRSKGLVILRIEDAWDIFQGYGFELGEKPK